MVHIYNERSVLRLSVSYIKKNVVAELGLMLNTDVKIYYLEKELA